MLNNKHTIELDDISQVYIYKIKWIGSCIF